MKGFHTKPLFFFSVILIFLMFVDFSTTNYAISNGIGEEGNAIMSGIVSNPILFIFVKLIGSMVIIFMMKICLERNKKVSFIGMRLIIFMMLFVVANNLFVISANALSFPNLSTGGTGSVNAGNGYFDDDASQFLYTGSRNIYTITEDTQINILEPINFANGVSGAVQVINASSGTLMDSVVHNGYLYFVDGTTLKKKKTRSNTGTCESNDTSAGGCISTVTTGVGETLRVYNNVLYFTVGTTGFKHLDSQDNVVNDFSVCAPFGSQRAGFTVTENNSVLQVYLVCNGSPITVRYFTSTTSVTFIPSGLGNAASTSDTFYTTSNYVYVLAVAGAGNNIEDLIRISNSTVSSIDYVTTNTLAQNNRVYVGGESTIGLLVQSSTTYETFNSNEAGVSSLPILPAEITYNSASVESQYSNYYNQSHFMINYLLNFDVIPVIGLIPLHQLNELYSFNVELIDPNNVQVASTLLPYCQGIVILTCNIQGTFEYSPPSQGWTQGSWRAKLYENNLLTGHKGLIVTSSAFTVLNTTVENQTVISNPTEPISSGSGSTALTQIDGFVTFLGLGVNAVSKFLFAMIVITIFLFFGFIATNYNINGGIAAALLPYTFFIFISYLPLWTIVIITIIVGMKLFR